MIIMEITIIPAFAFPGGIEVLLLVGIIVLLFGASKIPTLARSSGQAVGEFQKGRSEVEDELEISGPEEKEA